MEFTNNWILFLIFSILSATALSDKPPNVVFIWFDDLGFSEVGFNGGEFETPILDEIAANSIKLNNHYSELVCSASRSALLTGRYSWKTGLNFALRTQTDGGIKSDLSLLPELLKQKEYRSHITGKYHIGYKFTSDEPFERGFDEGLVGQIGGAFYSRIYCRPFSNFDAVYPISDALETERNNLFGTTLCGDDLFDENYDRLYTDNTDYIERIYTDDIIQFIENNSDENQDSDPFFVYNSIKTPHFPLVTPPDLVGVDYDALCGHLTNEYRLDFCKMVQYAENMIHEIIDALKTNGIYHNSVVIITSDNGGFGGFALGGAYASFSRNLPLRGTKIGPFEGGVRTMGLITGGYVDENILSKNETNSCEYNGLFHVSDWYHTILSIAGLKDKNVDDDHKGIDLWKEIEKVCSASAASSDSESSESSESSNSLSSSGRDEIIYMRMCGEAPDQQFYSTYIRNEEWKLVVNGSMIGRSDCPRAFRSTYNRITGYTNADGTFLTVPNEEEYMKQYNDEERRELYNSECYNNLNEQERNDVNNPLFVYDEFMLFNIETDKIEACNVAQQYPDIVDELFDILKERAYEYYSTVDSSAPPNGGAVLAQINSYDCDKDTTALVPWNGVDNNETDFEYIWQTYIDNKQNC